MRDFSLGKSCGSTLVLVRILAAARHRMLAMSVRADPYCVLMFF